MNLEAKFAGLKRRSSESFRYHRRIIAATLRSKLLTPGRMRFLMSLQASLSRMLRRVSERVTRHGGVAVSALRSMRTSRQRGALAGALAVTVASAVLPLTFGGGSLPAATNRLLSGRNSGQPLLGPNGQPVQRLGHGQSATAGKVRFTVAPPKLHGGKVDAALLSTTAGVPAVALAAYEHAAAVLNRRDPGCQFTWEDDAGIGRVESGNGLYWGSQARVTANGTLEPPIYGPSLDGEGGMPAMPTTDGGRLEQDGRWTRAVGPMQFLPATWAEYAQDGNGDGQKNPQNFYDAALTTAVFLCANGGDLARPSGLQAAILSYNHSTSYLQLVEAWIAFYTHAGTTVLLSAGADLLPVVHPASTSRHNETKPKTKSGARHKPVSPHKPPASHKPPARQKPPTKHKRPPGTTPSPATELASAAAATALKGSYKFNLTGYDGKSTVAAGDGGVDVTHSAGWLRISLPDVGAIGLRDVAGVSYLSLPPSLSKAVGAEGPWVVFTPTVADRLPQPLSSGLSVAANDLVWLAAQFEGGAKSVRTVGSTGGSSNGSTEYAGDLYLPIAIQRVTASSVDLGRVAQLLGSPNISMEAWVSPAKLLQSALIELGSGFSRTGAFMAEITFGGYGEPVHVTQPTVSPITPTPTTTTTTTTTTVGSTSTSSTTPG
jgi:hypothetical protein